ncbi:MAG: hypothetical protein QOE59_3205, partial [Actinomycetota bacterium]|nr:hypothetical protein [Actinomycetota bacterium]
MLRGQLSGGGHDEAGAASDE